MSNMNNPLTAPLRPGSVDVRGQQPTLFPFDAFEFDDPNRTGEPELRMKPPWTFVANGLVIYEDGVDPDNLVTGDRRLIVEGEVLKLQSWDGTEWGDDISLGGYDSNGEFIQYIEASGVIRDAKDVEIIKQGIGLPAPQLENYTHKFFNAVEQVRLGESDKTIDVAEGVKGTYDGKSFYESTGTFRTDNLYSGEINYWAALWNNIQSYDEYAIINFDSTTSMPGTPYIMDVATEVQLHQAKSLSPNIAAYTNFVTQLQVDKDGNLFISLRASARNAGWTQTVQTWVYDPGIVLDDGINYVNLKFAHVITPFYDGATTNLAQVQCFYNGVSIAIRNSSGYTFHEVPLVSRPMAQATSGTMPYTPTWMAQVVLPTHVYWSPGATNGRQAYQVVSAGSYSNQEAMASINVLPGSGPQKDVTEGIASGYFIDKEYFEDFFSQSTYLISAVDKNRDVSLIPSASFGKVFLANGGTIPESYSDKYITVSGPPGPQGEDGTQGDPGETGYVADAWDSGVTYNVNEVVIQNGYAYASLQGSNLNNEPSASTAYWARISSEVIPIGTIMATSFDTIPNGWLKLDGSLVPIADYPELYAEYGTDHGGDGVTTFGLPDAQGLVLAGQGESLLNGNSKGDATKDLLEKREDSMQQITGTLIGRGIEWVGSSASGAFSITARNNAGAGHASGNAVDLHLDSANVTRTETNDETHGSQLLIHWIVKARHSSTEEYRDPNIDQRLTDVENKLLVDTIYDTGWLDFSAAASGVTLLLSHNLGKPLDELDVSLFFKNATTGAIIKLGDATYSGASGGTFHNVNNNQIKYQNVNNNNTGLLFIEDTGAAQWVQDGTFDDIKFIIKPLYSSGLQGDDGATGAAGATGAQGIQGPNGPAIAADPYEAGTSYNTDEFCVHLGLVYISTIDSNLGNTPASSYPSWKEWNWSDGFVGMESFISVGGLPPTGWLKQDGTEYLKTDYPELWDFLGSDYESDATHFLVPNKEGISITGARQQTFASGVKGHLFNVPGELLDDHFQGHFHQVYGNNGASGAYPYGSLSTAPQTPNATYPNKPIEGTEGDGIPRYAAYTRGPSMVVEFIIKARNAVPTDSTDINVDSRLSAVETKNTTQDGRLDTLESTPKRKKFTRVVTSETYNGWFVEDEDGEMYGHTGNNTTYGYVMGMGRSYGQNFTKIPHHPETKGLTVVEQGFAMMTGYRLYSNGDLYLWGANAVGQICDGTTTTRTLPYKSLTSVNRVWPNKHCGNSLIAARFFAEKNDGTYWGAGHNGEGQLGLGVTGNTTAWRQITWLSNWSLRDLWSIGNYYGWTVWALTNGQIWFSGRNSQGQSGNGTTTATYSTPIRIDTYWGGDETTAVGEILDIVGTAVHANPTVYIRGSMCMLREDNSVRTVGYNSEGAVGNGNTTNPITTPYTVPGLGTVVEIANPGAGLATYYVRNISGHVYRWGFNGHYQIGKGATGNQLTPYNSGVSTDIDQNCSKIFNRRNHAQEDGYACAIFLKDSRDNTTWATGHNTSSAGGVGTNANIQNFTQVMCTEDFIDIKSNGYDVGGAHVEMITSDGRIFQCGYGGRYELYQQDPHPSTNRWVPFELPVN